MKKLLRAFAIAVLLGACGGLIGCVMLDPYVVYDGYGRPTAVISAPVPVLVPVPYGYPYGHPYGYPDGHRHHHRH